MAFPPAHHRFNPHHICFHLSWSGAIHHVFCYTQKLCGCMDGGTEVSQRWSLRVVRIVKQQKAAGAKQQGKLHFRIKSKRKYRVVTIFFITLNEACLSLNYLSYKSAAVCFLLSTAFHISLTFCFQ